MSSATTTIVYDGPALRDSAMDVRDLAPALLAVGQLFDAANTAINGENATIKVQVRATEPGSFQIVLELVQSFTEHLLSVLASPSANAAANLIAFVFGAGAPIGGGVVWLIKRGRGKNPDRIEKLSDNMVRIIIDGESMDTPVQVLRLYQDLAVRAAAQRLIQEPLAKDGIDLFEVRSRGLPVVSVSTSEASYFTKPQLADETLIDEVRRSAYSIISLAFKEDNKWRLNDGSNPISASIEDTEFLRKVDDNQLAFSKGDLLICDVRFVQRRTEQGLKTEHIVIRVVEHRAAMRQLPLPLPDPNEVPPQSSS